MDNTQALKLVEGLRIATECLETARWHEREIGRQLEEARTARSEAQKRLDAAYTALGVFCGQPTLAPEYAG